MIRGVDVAEIGGIFVDVIAVLGDETGFVGVEKEESLTIELAHVIGDHLSVVGAFDGVAVVVGLLEKLNEGFSFRRERGRGAEFTVGCHQNAGGAEGVNEETIKPGFFNFFQIHFTEDDEA